MRMFRLLAVAAALLGSTGCMTARNGTPRPATVRTVAYQCEGGVQLTVSYAPNWAVFADSRGQVTHLAQQVTGSGFAYRGAGHELRGKGDELRWTTPDGRTVMCNAGPSAEAATSLAGTKWQLVQFQSMDDAIGTIRPNDPTKYTMELMPDGQLAMQLDCNRAVGRWEAHPASATDGHITFIAPAMTRAMCLGPSMDDRIARDLEFVTSYKLVGDTLNLALKMDSGIYTWRRIRH